MAVAWAGSYSSDSTPAWELPYAMGTALKGKKKKKKSVIFITTRNFKFWLFQGAYLVWHAPFPHPFLWPFTLALLFLLCHLTIVLPLFHFFPNVPEKLIIFIRGHSREIIKLSNYHNSPLLLNYSNVSFFEQIL